jgi:hypothetical protein
MDATTAKAFWSALLAEGYIQREAAFGPDTEAYSRTIKGAAVAGASAAPPLKRHVVETRLRELVERMAAANDDDRFYVGVQDADVFGSYLTDAPTLSDLDVHYTTYRKIDDPAEFARVTEDAARASGRRFSRYIDLLFWPEAELRKFLKNRSRVYSLADNSQLLRDVAVPRLAIFRDRRPVAIDTRAVKGA